MNCRCPHLYRNVCVFVRKDFERIIQNACPKHLNSNFNICVLPYLATYLVQNLAPTIFKGLLCLKVPLCAKSLVQMCE